MPTKPKGGNIYLRLTAATLLPVAIAGLQALLWPYIPPLTWLLFYPAVFFSAWIGGLIGGILATCLAIVLGLQFFVPVEQSQDFRYIYSAVIFGCMGFLFSLVHERLHRASSELQRINALKLDASQARLGLALETANIGLWEWDLNARLQTWSDSLWELYGLTPHSQQPCHETWLTTVNVDDRTETARQLNKAIQTASEIDLEWRIANTAPGRERWLMLRGKPALDAIGRPSLYRGVVLDITHRKKIEHDLQDHEQRLDFALSTLEAGAWELNLQNHIAKRTPLHDRIFGYQEPLPEWTYATFLQHVLPEDREMVDRLFSIVNQTQCDSDFECRIRRADGQIRWIHAKSRTKYDKQGQPLFIAGIVQDISARKQAEIDRRYNEMRYHALVDQAAPEGIFIHDHQGNFIEVNQKACDNLGYLKSELLAMNVMDLEQDFDLASAQSEWSSLKPGMNKTLFGHHRRKDGSRFPVEVSFGLLEFDGQRFYITFVRDISERIRAENERKVNEERLSLQSSALQAVANAIMITSPDGVIEWVNPAFGALTGYPAEEAIGKTPRELSKSGLQKPDIYYELWSSVLSGNIWHGEIVNRRKDGSHYTEEQTITPLMDSQGVIRHYIAIKQDITKRKETEIELEHYRHHLEQLVEERTHELKEARSEAERLSQVKSAFLANMSHEIRTPMNAVLGFCYLLEQQPLNKNALQLINKIHAAGRSLLAIINDILDFSKIEAGRLEIEHVPFHLCDILDNLAALMEASAKHKHLELVITPPVDVNALIGDDLRLQQVLVNLLSNAIKFTERGEVALTINVDSITESKCNLRFAVKDTGIGISPEKLAEIFSAFAQADTTIGRRFGGAGLGLSISQKLVQLMGGRLNVESQPAQGSTFSFVLPLEMGRKHMPALPPPSLEKLNLLIADHSVTARNALINMAQSLNWSADAVDSGDAALLKCAVEKENGFPYDVILLDWKLPEQDGLATALSIRRNLENKLDTLKKPAIIIMVTAFSKAEMQDHPDISCVDGLLSKPVTPSALYDTINNIINNLEDRGAFRALPVIAHALRLMDLRVLVVDDSEINREVAEGILEADGATVKLAGDGQEAINYLSANPGSVDIILMDVQMPYMDGYTATRIIRQDKRWEKIPIVALTAGAFESLRDAAFAAGMDDYIAKPFNVEQLISVIQRLTQHQDNASEPQTQLISAAIPVSGLQPGAVNIGGLPLPAIDYASALERWRTASVYHTYLRKFVADYAHAGKEIAAFMLRGDIQAAKNLAHKLIGVAGNLGLLSVEAQTRAIYALLAAEAFSQTTAAPLQTAIDEACASIAKLAMDTPIYDAPSGKEKHKNCDSVVTLLENLLNILDKHDPDLAESQLSSLQGLIAEPSIAQVQAYLEDFDFNAAKAVIRALLDKLQ